MRLPTLGAAIAVIVSLPSDSNAADFIYVYPPPPIEASPYRVVPDPEDLPPPPVVVPAPAPVPAPPARARPTAPPQDACAPVWRCQNRGCGWQPACPSQSDVYSDRRELPPPQEVLPRPQTLPRPQALPRPQDLPRP